MKKLLVATNNKGKIIEFNSLLDEYGFELCTPGSMEIRLEVNETGATYSENASLKAEAYFQKTGLSCLGDDSGLEVASLNGAPGIHSARFSPIEGATDRDRRDYLLSQLKHKPPPWKARFICVLAITYDHDKTVFFQGTCPGEIIPEEIGDSGFGYDPIFYIPELKRTMAELTMEEKNQVSHRARAVHAAGQFFKSLSRT